MTALVLHDWPGNVRQLKNTVTQLTISSMGGREVGLGAETRRLLGLESAPAPPPDSPPGEPPRIEPARPTRGRIQLADVTDEQLVAALEDNAFGIRATARALGISRTSLYALIRACPGARVAEDIPDDEIVRSYDQCSGDLGAMVPLLRVSQRALRLRMKRLFKD
jgi:two-component system, NtrC family, nitrogen regulation response regulator GlnG